MPERASVTQGLYIAPETVAGDGGTTFKTLNSFDLEPGVKVDMQRFKPQGRKLESIVVPGKEWTEFSLNGLAEYSELHYLLGGLLGANQTPQPTTVDTTGKRWRWKLSPQDIDAVQTFGIKKGDSTIAEAFAYGIFTEVGMDLSREGIKLDGALMSRAMTTGSTIPGSPGSITEVPLLPKEVSVYLTETYASLGASKLTRALMVKQTIGDRFNPVWVLDAAQPSFVAHVELAPKFEIELTVEADAAGVGFIPNTMRAGDTIYMRIEAVSPVLAGASTEFHRYTQDTACKIADVDKFEDNDGVYAIKYTLAVIYDPVQALSIDATLVNKQAGY